MEKCSSRILLEQIRLCFGSPTLPSFLPWFEGVGVGHLPRRILSGRPSVYLHFQRHPTTPSQLHQRNSKPHNTSLHWKPEKTTPPRMVVKVFPETWLSCCGDFSMSQKWTVKWLFMLQRNPFFLKSFLSFVHMHGTPSKVLFAVTSSLCFHSKWHPTEIYRLSYCSLIGCFFSVACSKVEVSFSSKL